MKQSSHLEQRLGSFLSQLPPNLALKLGSALRHEQAAGRSDLPYDILLNALSSKERRKTQFNPIRQFCVPFESLLVNRIGEQRLIPEIERASIMKVWVWLQDDLLPDALLDMSRKLIEYAGRDDMEARESLQAVLHATCSSAILSSLEKLRGERKARAALEQRLGGEKVLEDARKMAEAMAVAPSLCTLHNDLPKRIPDFNAELVSHAENAYRRAVENSPSHAIYVAWDIMCRLSHPWQILRLAKRLAGVGNENKLHKSALYEIGDAFVREMEGIAGSFEGKRRSHVDSEAIVARINRFVEISKGVIGEIDIRRCSEWGQRILASRAILSAALSEDMSRFEQDVGRALPFMQIGSYGKSGPKKPDFSHDPDADHVGQALSSLHILKGACAAAESIGLQAHCKIITQQIDKYLAAYEDWLLDEIRRGKDASRERAMAYLEVVASFYEAMGADKMAETLRRRGNSAAASSH